MALADSGYYLGLLGLAAMRHESGASPCAMLIVESVEVPTALQSSVRIYAEHCGFDLAFERLLRFVLGPLPDWLQLYCRPSQTRAITGAAWWNDDILLADEYYDHIVRIKQSDSALVLPGVDEPYHLYLDRRTLFATHLGGDEIICARLRGGMVLKIWALTFAAGKKLRRPHGVFQGNGYSIIADTDNQRILWSRQEITPTTEWQTIENVTKYPCGVFGGGDSLWIADSFNHRILRLNPQSKRMHQVGSAGNDPGFFYFPVGVCAWNDLLFVSDEQNKRLQLIQIIDSTTGIVARVLDHQVAGDYIASPVGVSVNRYSRVLIGDRECGCCWVVDLRKLPMSSFEPKFAECSQLMC
jgi:hypothetical protein